MYIYIDIHIIVYKHVYTHIYVYIHVKHHFWSIDRVLYPGIAEMELQQWLHASDNCVDKSIRNTHHPMRLVSCLGKLLYQVSKIQIYAKQRFISYSCLVVVSQFVPIETNIWIFPPQKTQGWDGGETQMCRLLLLWRVSRWLWIVFQPYGRGS